MTILFLLQTHKDPEHLYRLVSLLRRGCPTCKVLISHDELAKPLPSSLFEEDPAVRVITGRGGRGDFLIVDGYLKALKYLSENKIEYDWLINLSGSDYPVTSLRDMEAELQRTEFDGFVHHFDVLESNKEAMLPMSWPAGEGYDRYYYQYKKYKNTLSQTARNFVAFPRIFAKRYLKQYRIFTAYGLMVGSKAHKTPFSPEFKCYAGSYWHAIRRKCAEYILEYTTANPEVKDYFRHVLIPDESYIQSVLVNNHNFRFSPNNRRFFDMSQSRHGHPKLLSQADMSKITHKGYFFARKLEAASGAEVFDQLDLVALS
jgi:hypothetical protein